jgi:undecaprenyl-diphosphatase
LFKDNLPLLVNSMTFFQALIMGIIQGLTEFLPISSSAHLVLTPFLLGWDIPQEQVFPFGVLVQIGTLIAVIIYFFNDLYALGRDMLKSLFSGDGVINDQNRLGWLIIAATIPAGVVGLLLDDVIEQAFNSPVTTAFFLYITAFLLLIGEHFGRRERSLTQLSWIDAIWIGISQALAVFPGISRSGATITAGMLRHVKRADAGRFSFLMAVPIMLAAGLKSAFDLLKVPNLDLFIPVLAVGFISSAVVGYLSIHWLLGYLNRNSMRGFAFYCILVASVILILAYVL